MNIDLITALIDASATILSTAVPSLVAYQATKGVLNLKQARGTAKTALREVAFMRKVEERACEIISGHNDKTVYANRLEIRKQLAKDDIRTEGKLAPNELARRLRVYESHQDEQP